MLLKIIPDKTNINFIGRRGWAFVLSIVLITASIGLLVTRSLNFGIDFTGGVVIELRTDEPVDLAEMRNLLGSDSELGDVSLQHFGSENDIMIRIGLKDGDQSAKSGTINRVKQILDENIQTGKDYRQESFVGPQVGDELKKSGAMALGLALLGILTYIWIRFEWQFGIGAVAALFHDVLLTLGLYSLLSLEFNLTSIAAILTIIGYSINDSVVTYDRIRENMRKYKKMPLGELLNKSINEMLSRTLLTSGTTIAALLALVLFGGEVIKGFSIAVLFGVIIGTYSSIFIAAPLLIFMNIRPDTAEKPAVG